MHFTLFATQIASCKRALYCTHRIWITGKSPTHDPKRLKDGVRLFFRLYGTFSPLLCVWSALFFLSSIPTSPAPDLLSVYYGYYGLMSDFSTVQSQTYFRRQEAGLVEIRVGVGKEYRGWSAGVTRALSGYSHGWAPRLCPENQQVRISNAPPSYCV